ncbi:hypothetical protein [Escherichia coli]
MADREHIPGWLSAALKSANVDVAGTQLGIQLPRSRHQLQQ